MDITLSPNIFKPPVKLFQPRNDWGLVKLRCRKDPAYTDFQTFLNLAALEIEIKQGINPFERTNYRGREYVEARQLMMVMLDNYTKKSLSVIGRLFGKDHATVIHARKTIQNLCETDRSFRKMYDEIDIRVCQLSKKLR